MKWNYLTRYRNLMRIRNIQTLWFSSFYPPRQKIKLHFFASSTVAGCSYQFVPVSRIEASYECPWSVVWHGNFCPHLLSLSFVPQTIMSNGTATIVPSWKKHCNRGCIDLQEVVLTWSDWSWKGQLHFYKALLEICWTVRII